MKPLLRILLLAITQFLIGGNTFSKTMPDNYVFFNLDRERIWEPWFCDQKLFVGAQIKYPWKTLETAEDTYDFQSIISDLAFLDSKGKKLFIQMQDVSFDASIINVPAYILKGTEYNGGANLQYYVSDDFDNNPQKAGWVARRWDPTVSTRFHKLLEELGNKLDGRIAGITLPETSVDFGSTGKLYPSGFNPGGYRDAIKQNIYAAHLAFSESTVIQYANFMPGEWLPGDNKGYLSSVFEYARLLNIGIGGPDIIPNRKGQMNHSYKYAHDYRGLLRIGYAVQEGNYSQTNAKTGAKLTVREIYEFATDYLGVDYIFWYPEEPYFTRDVLPYLKNRSQ